MGKKKKEKRDPEESSHSSRKRDKDAKKAALKAKETPDERRARRLAKKMKKKANQMMQDNVTTDYTDESNPFGDANLTKPFVWKKKYEKDLAQGIDPRKLTKKELKAKQLELRDEIAKVKVRRKQREEEKAQMEEMRAQLQRDIDTSVAEDWEEKEEDFHRNQAKLRSVIRIREGREKAIDILAKNLNLFHQDEVLDAHSAVDLDVELAEPYKIFDGLSVKDLNYLRKDIQEHVNLGSDLEYWSSLLTVCDDEKLKETHKKGSRDKRNRYGLHVAVQEEVVKMLDGKSRRDLDKLHKNITEKIEKAGSGLTEEAVDVPYWEAVLKQLTVWKAKAFLREFHQQLLKKRLNQLKNQQIKEMEGKLPRPTENMEEPDFEPELIPVGGLEGEGEKKDGDGMEEDYEPPLVTVSDIGDLEPVDPEEDARDLQRQRAYVLEMKKRDELEAKQEDEIRRIEDEAKESVLPNRFMLTGEQLYEQESRRAMEADEAKFADEISVPETPYWWHDKYRPRKPRYFNRVKTGYEWNKYNQTHYDKENPPPKIVQGYKFNVFYPDLIDPSKTPKYILEALPENPDYCLIRFSAGPPYEDIAFKIVNKEWEYSHKRGFKCVFDRNILHLYFNFRRYRYRR